MFRARRASTYFLVGLLAVGASGALFLGWQDRQTRQVYVAARALPPYHQITKADLRQAKVRTARLPEKPIEKPDEAVGRYTLSAVGLGRSVSGDALGPKLPEAALAGLSIASLPAFAVDTGGGAFTRGDQVRILLSSTASENPRSGTLTRVRLLDVRPVDKQPEHVVLVIAFPAAEEPVLLAAGGTAKPFIVRVPMTGTP